MTPFAQKVYTVLKRVPAGKVTTYAEIALALGGGPLMARAVGNALNKNPHLITTPCHRVVKSNGEIGGFAKGASMKQELLEKEGVEVKSGKVNLDRYLFRLV